jgi:hypothetical protein
MGKTSEELGARDEAFIGSSLAQRRRWSGKLGVSAAELQEAIDAVGACPEDVERYLRNHALPWRSSRQRRTRDAAMRKVRLGGP